MPMFRKKPVVVEASQWFKDGDHLAVERGFIRWGFEGEKGNLHAIYHNDRLRERVQCGRIQTLEGPHEVTPGDWIITGVKGEHYPCKPDIFALTYEPA